jgi:hypothetical protein
MQIFKHLENNLEIKVDTTELKESQIRLIKSVNTLLTQLMTTSEEGEFFENTADIMRTIATAVKNANFSKSANAGIAYAEQALEYSLDTLSDEIHDAKFVRYDN